MSNPPLPTPIFESLAAPAQATQTIIVAQTFNDNLGQDVSGAFNNFIESGQVWALGIGFVLGYIVRSFTAY
ncbi:hypothetical protein [Lyngbya confervoides]|uniref:Uncharacterized protein n=1 Tax=Lyngbya confervoides BDU141951 TaxID=1574623 RepID=A0ABD4T6L8_9CYAN|nr:hypothetical protein [Lyngbya confervoides]MCM1984354.1 hypothetical protein [Lyngbya confervoides BDU141951]